MTKLEGDMVYTSKNQAYVLECVLLLKLYACGSVLGNCGDCHSFEEKADARLSIVFWGQT